MNNFIKTAFLMLTFFCLRTDAFAQCYYVTGIEPGNVKKIPVSADFPVYQFTMRDTNSLKIFQTEVTNWKTKHPDQNQIIFFPTNTHDHFEISQKDFDSYSESRKKIILSVPFFYTIIPNN